MVGLYFDENRIVTGREIQKVERFWGWNVKKEL